MLGNKNKAASVKQILVLGGGFGGIRASLDVAKQLPTARVILVSREEYHFYPPAYYEVATTLRSDGPAYKLRSTVGFPIAKIIAPRKNIIFKQALVEKIDVDRKLVHTDDGDLAYDALVVALGSVSEYFGVEGLERNSLSLKVFSDAITLRNRVAAALEKYKQSGDEAYLTFVIGGGGFTGVELAAELVRYLKHLRRLYAVMPEFKLWLVEGAPQLIPGLPLEAGKKVLSRMQSLGINIMLDSRVTQVTENEAVVNGTQQIPTKTVIWTGGVKSAPVSFVKNIGRDKKDRIIASSRLNLESYPEVFLIGDCACYIDPAKGAALPPTAQVAIHQAKYVARAIKSLATKSELPLYRPPKNHPFLVPLSGKYALFVNRGRTYTGFFPYFLRRVADLRYFVSIIPFWRAFNFWLKGSILYLKND